MAGTLLFYDEIFLLHETGAHPENKRRVGCTYESLCRPPALPGLATAAVQRASREDLELVHEGKYLDMLSALPEDEYAALDADTIMGPGSLEAACSAAGAVIAAVDRVTSGDCASAFCLVRPPGHHAMPGRAMGFCIFNNLAVGAAHALARCGHDRVAVIDFDVHHGNGTQSVFYADDRVFFASIHQYPFYPGTGAAHETGEGKGRGRTLNVPLPAGSTEAVYMEALADKVLPAVREYAPSLIMVSAGFDAHAADPIGGMRLETGSYGRMTAAIMEIAGKCCRGRVVSVLEGGYNPDALAASVRSHLGALSA